MRYSDAELRLLRSAGLADEILAISPMAAYQIAINRAFLSCASGPHIDALRRAWYAIQNSLMLRMTPEFDEYIKF